MKINILQPYVPGYRVPFFSALRERMASSGVDLRVFAANAVGAEAGRQDASTLNDWEVRIPQHSLPLGRRRLSVPFPGREFYRADGIIVGLVGTLPQAHIGVASVPFGGPRVGLWGHVKNYVDRGNPLDTRIEKHLMRRADAIFAYTPGGADFARLQGVPERKLVTVMNTLDLSYTESPPPREAVERFCSELSINMGDRILSYVGGLDASKRIAFLASALDALWRRDESVKVIVAGQGPDARLLAPHEKRGQVVRVGFAGPAVKALIGATTSAILMPGRIGLIACDALAMGVPIASTRWPFHAPEAEYLNEGDSVFYSADNPEDYARLLHETHFERRRRDYPHLNQMVENFAEGIGRLLTP